MRAVQLLAPTKLSGGAPPALPRTPLLSVSLMKPYLGFVDVIISGRQTVLGCGEDPSARYRSNGTVGSYSSSIFCTTNTTAIAAYLTTYYLR